MLFTGLGSVRIVKNCDLGLENAVLGLRPRAAFSIELGHSFSPYGPPSRQITYIYVFNMHVANKETSFPRNEKIVNAYHDHEISIICSCHGDHWSILSGVYRKSKGLLGDVFSGLPENMTIIFREFKHQFLKCPVNRRKQCLIIALKYY